jgi:hypothetical protein
MRRATMSIENIGDPMYSPSHTVVTAWTPPIDVLLDDGLINDFVEDWATLPPAPNPVIDLTHDADEHNAETFGNTDFIYSFVAANWTSVYPAVAALTLEDLIL